jgi:hypothetical protein
MARLRLVRFAQAPNPVTGEGVIYSMMPGRMLSRLLSVFLPSEGHLALSFVLSCRGSIRPTLNNRTHGGLDNPAVLVPVRFGECVIVGKKENPKLIGTDEMPMM